MLVDDRYCPRCDKPTAWDNSGQDGSLVLACSSVDEDGRACGLTTASALTEEEHDRLLAYDARPVTRRRRPYMVV